MARFGVVGGCGFIVNYIALAILYSNLKMPIVPAQLIGAEAALLTTFIGNNAWAFRDHHHIPVRKKLVRYHGTSWAGIAITSTTVIVLVHFAKLHYGIALAISASIGMVWNYTWNHKVIFKKLTND